MRFLPILAALAATPVAAHEFWIEPTAFAVAPSDDVIADIKVGQAFSGANYSYVPNNFVRFDMVQNGTVTPVEGRAGDRPALNMPAMAEGLVTLVHETTTLTVHYKEWEKFVSFVTHKDFPTVLDDHIARGLPQEGFREEYIRYAKSLVAIGAGEGADTIVGLRTEIVAEANPYTDDLSAGFPVQVLLDGEPRADAQIELFAKTPDTETEITLHRTDAEGRALLPVKPGTTYLVDAVAAEAIGTTVEAGPVWRTLWASLTFQTPQ